MKEHTHVFFINRDIKDIYKDIDINNRPLLKDNKEILFDIYEKRKELYINTAKYNINNKNKKRTLIEIYKIIDIIKE